MCLPLVRCSRDTYSFVLIRTFEDDILRARIQTTRVVKHTFDLNGLNGCLLTWNLYDMGGSPGQRNGWTVSIYSTYLHCCFMLKPSFVIEPYFDIADVVIFVAPMSAFDQVSISSVPFSVYCFSVFIVAKITIISCFLGLIRLTLQFTSEYPNNSFTQALKEDPRTNGIEDSLQIFAHICESPLVEKAVLILLLSKVHLPFHHGSLPTVVSR